MASGCDGGGGELAVAACRAQPDAEVVARMFRPTATRT